MPDHNVTCPHCGEDGTLVANITVRAYGVPLHEDGYSVEDARGGTDDEITALHCSACRQAVDVDHYFSTQ